MSPWQYVVGMLPHKVVAYEDTARKGVVYLRWRIAGEWVRRSLGFTLTRDQKGRVRKDDEQRARKAADEQYARLITGAPLANRPAALLSIADGWSIATDAERGRWNKVTPHRNEMDRYLQRAKSVLGASTPWNAIARGDIRRLWRAELKRAKASGHDGARSAELIVSRFLTVAAWLRDEQLIAPDACQPWARMKEEMAEDIGGHEPHRPRYTLEEYRALLQHAPAVDVRWGLLLTLGAEYRLGQVVRCRRSDVTLSPCLLRIAGAGKKRGTLVQLTDQQSAALGNALNTWLAGLEAAYQAGTITDYPLFPGGRLPMREGAPVTRADHATRAPLLAGHTLRLWLRDTEAKAKVAYVEGRGWYGLRRAAVDAAKAAGISREGLQQHGGWSDTQVPDRIYADQQQSYAATEAAEIRAKIRGEIPQETEQNGARSKNGPAGAGPSKSSNSRNSNDLP